MLIGSLEDCIEKPIFRNYSVELLYLFYLFAFEQHKMRNSIMSYRNEGYLHPVGMSDGTFACECGNIIRQLIQTQIYIQYSS